MEKDQDEIQEEGRGMRKKRERGEVGGRKGKEGKRM